MMTEQHKYAAIFAALVAVFLTGRASVGGVSHTDECDPEISALEVAERQVGELTGKLASAEARGLERAVCSVSVRPVRSASAQQRRLVMPSIV
jgi:hypothetical protein